MLRPMNMPGSAGYVPLCTAVQWIMANGGARVASLSSEAWDQSVSALWPLVCSGEIES